MKILTILVLFLLATASFAGTEIWSATSFSFPMKNSIKIDLIEELRFTLNNNGLYYLQTYLGPTFKLHEVFDLSIYYARNDFIKNGTWGKSDLGYLDGTIKLKKPWFSFKDRNRIEYNITQDAMKYRNQFTFGLGNWAVSDELFWDMRQSLILEERTQISYGIAPSKAVAISLGYLLRRTRSNAFAAWQGTDVANLSVKMVF